MQAARYGGSALKEVLVQPAQLEKPPPCNVACGVGTDVRGWIALVAQHARLGLSKSEAYAQAWTRIAAVNPFPATMGRICPHPCEGDCNRASKDGAVSINALERFLGDWGLGQKLRLPLAEGARQTESVGVIGAGPAGLSFAYQMARRGYAVTVYETRERPGGLLQFGVPEYRLPKAVLQAEIRRILDLGVELRLNAAVGRDISTREIRRRHRVVFLGIGSGTGLKLGIPGETGTGVWTGLEFLSVLNRGKSVSLGEKVVVVGGGNTAVDAARSARRLGAQVTLLYRRTRNDMPAVESEVESALEEYVTLACLSVPLEIMRAHEQVRSVRVQRMQLGKPDRTGRRTPVAVSGSEYEIPASAVITAVSQVPNWEGLGELKSPDTWTGGDVLGPGLAGTAIGQGLRAAEAAHAQLCNQQSPPVQHAAFIRGDAIKPDYYWAKARSTPLCAPVRARLARPGLEVRKAISEPAFRDEASRCFCCGSCFGCEHCFMYCSARAFSKLNVRRPGEYFSLNLDDCESCGKCIDVCPSGFLSPRGAAHV